MNSDNFSDFLEQPSHLYQIPYEELKSLVLQYPYCQNLRYLLLKKSKMENHRDYDKNLHMAATFSPDRAFLLQQIQKTAMSREAQEAYELAEDFLELKDLREVQNAMKEVRLEEVEVVDLKTEAIIIDPGPSVPDDEIPSPAFSLPEITPEEPDENIGHIQDLEEEIRRPETVNQRSESLLPGMIKDVVLDMAPAIDLVQELEFTTPPIEEIPVAEIIEIEPVPIEETPLAPAFVFELDSEIIEDCSTGIAVVDQLEFKPIIEKAPIVEVEEAIAPEPATEKKSEIILEISPESNQVSKPTPKTSFSSWLRQFQSPQVSVQLNQILEIEKPKKKKRKKKQNNEAKALAVKSVQAHGLASETLAIILTKQGHYTKAYQMYLRLISMHPEKSDYFNGKLNEIKPKLR